MTTLSGSSSTTARLQFRGSVTTSDAGLLAYRELDDALGLRNRAREVLADAWTGKNGRHALAGLLRQARRLAGLRRHRSGAHQLEGI